MKNSITFIGDIPVVYIIAKDGLAGAKEAFKKLKTIIGKVSGKKFYGVFDKENNEYRACVKIEGDINNCNLERGVIPGGKYARKKIKDWSKSFDRVSISFSKLCEKNKTDLDRPTVEFYRSVRDLIVMVPVR